MALAFLSYPAAGVTAVVAPPAAAGRLFPAPSGGQPLRAATAASGRASSSAASFVAAGACGFAAAVAGAARREARSHRRSGRRAFRDGSEGRGLPVEITDTDSPDNLYELFQLRPGADAREIKKAYYNMQKVCHPDVAGEEGEEMCILLNDAYDTLSDKESRALYDEQLAQMQPEAIGSAAPIEVAKDLDPVWPWQPKKHGKPPVWKGTPLSRSRWDRVPPEGQGQKHQDQQFVYVDEFSCIACRNCCDVAPKSFCIDIEHGRARVYSQWGHDEEWLDYAVAACPVDCIHWVSREELQVLEHVTAEKLFEGGAGSLPCPMAVRQGMAVNTNDPWDMANGFNERMKRKEERWKKLNVTVDKFKARIAEVFLSLSLSMRQAIRGQGQKGA